MVTNKTTKFGKNPLSTIQGVESSKCSMNKFNKIDNSCKIKKDAQYTHMVTYNPETRTKSV